MSEWGPTLSRRTLLKTGGAAAALGGLGTLSACGDSGAKGGSNTFRMLYFGDQNQPTRCGHRWRPKSARSTPKSSYRSAQSTARTEMTSLPRC